MSRHGLEITYGQACDIIHGLGGGSLSHNVIGMIADPTRLSSGNASMKKKPRIWQRKTPGEQVLEDAAAAANENEENETELYHPKVKYLDMVQVVSIVLMPTLARFAKEWKQDQQRNYAFSNMNSRSKDGKDDDTPPIEAPVDIPAAYKDENDDEECWSPGGEETQATLSKHDDDEESSSEEPGRVGREKRVREVHFDTPRESEVREATTACRDEERPSLKDFGKARSVREIDENAPSLQPEPIGLIRDVLKMLLRDYKSSSLHEGSSPAEAEEGPLQSGDPVVEDLAPLVTPKLVEALLRENGDFERARDAALIRRMVDAAHSPSGRLDEEALINALTSDLDQWEVGCEDRRSTYVFDVFGTDDIPAFQRLGEKRAKEKGEDLEDPSTEDDDDDDIVKLHKKRSGKVIDSVVDSYASFFSLLLIWLFFLGLSSVYAGFIKAANFSEASCKLEGEASSFPCTLLATVYTW